MNRAHHRGPLAAVIASFDGQDDGCTREGSSVLGHDGPTKGVRSAELDGDLALLA
jgi:hypothetical protein